MNRVNIEKKYANFNFSSIPDKNIFASDYIAKGNALQAHINIQKQFY